MKQPLRIALLHDSQSGAWVYRDLEGLGIIGEAVSVDGALSCARAIAASLLRDHPEFSPDLDFQSCPAGWTVVDASWPVEAGSTSEAMGRRQLGNVAFPRLPQSMEGTSANALVDDAPALCVARPRRQLDPVPFPRPEHAVALDRLAQVHAHLLNEDTEAIEAAEP